MQRLVQHRIGLYWLTILAIVVSNPISANSNAVPEIGKSFAQFSHQDEYLIGRAWLYTETPNLPILLSAPLLQDYLNQLSQQILGYTGMNNLRLKVVILLDPNINAFAAPGGVIGINLGLLAAAESEDELASVIAHEYAHLSQRHTLELIASAKNRSALTFGSFIAGFGMMIIGNPALGLAALFSGVANDANLTLDAIRRNEEEADSISFETMRKAGRNPSAGLSFMERLHRLDRDGNVQTIFSSHPLSSERITSLRNRIQNTAPMQLKPSASDNFNFYTAKAIAGKYLAEDPKKYIAQLKAHQTNQFKTNKDAYMLATASIYNQIRESAKALPILEKLHQKYPLQQYISAQYALALTARKQNKLASNIIETQLKLNPNNYLLNLVEIDIQLHKGRNKEAIQLLEQMAAKDDENLWLWNRLYEQYGKQQQIDKAHFAKGQIQYLLGIPELAIMQFNLAVQKTSNTRLKALARDRITTIQHHQARLEDIL